MGQANRLPSRFPDGTRFIIEGRDGRITLRYLEFPNGRHVDLPADPAQPRASVRRRLRKTAARNPRK